MVIKRFYQPKDINLGSIRAIRDSLTTSLSWAFATAQYQIYYPAEIVTCEKITEIESVIKDRGHPERVWFQLKSQGGRSLTLDAIEPSRLTIEVNNLGDPLATIFDVVEPALQLTPLDDVPLTNAIVSAFVAHSFDLDGQNYANERRGEGCQEPLFGLTVMN